MKKWENLEAALLTVAFLVMMLVPMISLPLLDYLSKIGHSVWGVAFVVLGYGVCFIMLFVIWGCGYVSGMNEKEKENKNDI